MRLCKSRPLSLCVGGDWRSGSKPQAKLLPAILKVKGTDVKRTAPPAKAAEDGQASKKAKLESADNGTEASGNGNGPAEVEADAGGLAGLLGELSSTTYSVDKRSSWEWGFTRYA